MSESRDPVEARADDDRDLYEVSTWEARTALDSLATGVYSVGLSTVRLLVVLFGVAIFGIQFALGGLGAVTDPIIGVFTLLSAVPALALAGYVWYTDATTSEPLELLVGTFVLGVLFAGFAGILNSLATRGLELFGLTAGVVGFAFQILFFFLVVGPVEEAVKLLAVRLYAYRKPEFNAVIDGAVYGAVAGLGFATIENAIYITGQTEAVADPLNLVVQGSAVTAVRALAGPGHVIYSAFAGYYLGLAKFNRENAGPIVVKGLLIAALVHATYNTLSSFVPSVVAQATGVSWFVVFFGFIVVYDGVFALILLRKLSRYSAAYDEAHAVKAGRKEPDLTEFDG